MILFFSRIISLLLGHGTRDFLSFHAFHPVKYQKMNARYDNRESDALLEIRINLEADLWWFIIMYKR